MDTTNTTDRSDERQASGRSPSPRPGFAIHTRSGGSEAESEFEKPMILPEAAEKSPTMHAWADARFATDIMAEHALFFTLLMPPELAQDERKEAQQFHKTFADLFGRIETSGPPDRSDLKAFATAFTEAVKPFIDYKARLGEAQTSGSLRSLVWPLFFDHTRHEAERWTRRLETLAGGESELDRSEVSGFWTNIMDEHARFVAHLLDPDEYELIDTCMKTSRVFADLHKGGLGGVVSALVDEPGTVTDSLIKNPETDAILSAAQTILDFKTEATRNIEAARIKSIIDPRLADHVRREALKFVDELKRAV
ncbi:MAG: DUF2935 domain-containing protein [Sphingosinicella sp.]